MRIARRAFLASSIGMAAAPAILRTARGDTPAITLKLHHAFSSVSGVHDKFLVPWARKVEAESGGRMRVDIFPSMQLGGAPAALFDQARDGSTDIVWAAPSLTPGRFPKIETFELPFLSSRRALVSAKALTDFAAVNLQDEFRDFYTICFSSSDRAVIHATRPVRTIEDVKNVKLHVQTRLAAEAMRALGAQPVMMPNAQLPAAVTEHVVDACLDPWHVVPSLRLNDLFRSHTEFSDQTLSARTYVLAMNRAIYDRLPHDLKNVIDNNSGQSAAAMSGAMWDLQAAAVANMVVERGALIVTLLPEAEARWRKAIEPVIDAWRKEIKEQKIDATKLLAAAHLLLAKYAKEPELQPASPPQQAVAQPTQPPPQPSATPKLNNPPLSNASSASPPARSAAKPPSPTPVPAQPAVMQSAPKVATPTPASAPLSPTSLPPAAPSAAVGPAAKPLAATTPPMSSPKAVSTSATTAAPVAAPTGPAPATSIATPAPAPAPGAQPGVAIRPASPPAPPMPKPVPKTLDIPL